MSVWECPSCTVHNELEHQTCHLCLEKKPSSAAQEWLEFFDPKHNLPYYYNEATKKTVWTLPAGAVVLNPGKVRRPADQPPRGGASNRVGSPPGSRSPGGRREANGSSGNGSNGWLRGGLLARGYPGGRLQGALRAEPATVDAAAPAADGGAPWNCPACTFFNVATDSCCAICKTQKKASIRAAQVRSGHSGEPGVEPFSPVGEGSLGFCFDEQKRDWVKKVEQLERELAGKRATFVDETFPPTITSVYGTDMETLGSADDGIGILEWKRCSDLRGGRFHGVSSKPWRLADRKADGSHEPVFSSGAIAQGQLGDCWFLSALAVVSTRPELIRRIFISQSFSPQGIYCLRFWHNGVWTPVLVDDYFPQNFRGGFAFATGKDNQLWPSLVEKAYAKLHGSYKAICGGTARDALTDLTGAPCHKLNLEKDPNADDLWINLISAYTSGCLMSASCGKKGAEREAYRMLGLVSNHCYTVLAVEDMGNGLQLVKLRNPWGKEEWKGDWGDNSPLWTPDLRRRVRFENKNDDGQFFMAFADVLQYFSCIDVCRTHEDWHSFSTSDWFSKKAAGTLSAQFSTAYALRITTPTWIFASIVQRDERGAEVEYQYKDAGIVIIRVLKETRNILNPLHFEYTAGELPAVQRMSTCDAILHHAGLYLLFPLSLLNKASDLPYTLALWSSKKVSVEKEPLLKAGLHPIVSALHKMICSGRADPKKVVPFPGTCLRQIQNAYGVWIHAENRTNKVFTVTLDSTGSHGLVSSRGTYVTVDTITPGGSMLLQCFSAILPNGGWSWKGNQKFELSSARKITHNPGLPSSDHIHAELLDAAALAAAMAST